jgi:hypothetical protein
MMLLPQQVFRDALQIVIVTFAVCDLQLRGIEIAAVLQRGVAVGVLQGLMLQVCL